MARRWIRDLITAPRIQTIRRAVARPELMSFEDRLVPTVFTNPATIAIPDTATTVTSQINVTGLNGVVKTVAVTLNGLTHSNTQDLDVLLVGPGGQAVKILSDVGGSANTVTLVDLTFDDTAADPLPAGFSASGAYQPTDVALGAADAWTGFTGTPGSKLNATFRNTSGNGVWTLYVVDDSNQDVGEFSGGWSLDIFSRVNSAPVGVADNYTTTEDGGLFSVTAANGVLLGAGADTDANGDPLTATLVSAPVNGTFAFNADGSFDYTPFLDFNGTDSFTYRADDGFTQGSLATATITVTAADDAPIAKDDFFVASKNTTLVRTPTVGVVANDLHADGANRVTLLSETFEDIALVDYTANSTTNGWTANTATTEDWSPVLPAGWSTLASLTTDDIPLTNEPTEFKGWRVHNIDSWNATDPQGRDSFFLGQPGKAGRILVADSDEYDDGPQTGAIRFRVNTRPIDLRGVLPNSAKIEFDSSFRNESPSGSNDQTGTLRVSYDGGANFEPVQVFDQAYTGDDDFTRTSERISFNLNNPAGKDSAIVQWDYNGTNDWWWALDDVIVTGARTLSTGLTATLVSSPVNGTLVGGLNANGSFTYTPNSGFTGADTFTYTLNDGITTSAAATVTINVRDGNPNLPIANGETFFTLINQSVGAVSNNGLLANDTDADSDPLTAILVAAPTKGALTLNPDGSFKYVPNLNVSGKDTFTYKANDVFGDSAIATVTIVIIGNDPVITSDGGGATAMLTRPENAPAGVVTTVTATDVDAGQTLSYSIVGGSDADFFSIDAANGMLTFTKSVNFELPADADENNTYNVVVRATDSTTAFDAQTITVTITDVGDFDLFSNGGGAAAALKVSEHTQSVTTVKATLPGTTYALIGGADKARFSIDSATGKVAFLASADFESPADANLDNVYEIVVQAMNGSNTIQQTIAVQVLNVLGEEQARPDIASTQKAEPLTVAAPGVLGNDSTRITLFAEGFEGPALKPFRTGNYVSQGDGTDWTDELPGGWIRTTTNADGTVPLTTQNPVEYRGWTILDVDSWAGHQGQERNVFTLGGLGQHGSILVADGDTFANADGSGIATQNGTNKFQFDLPSISLSGIEDNTARLEFDSSWRPEGAQFANLEYSLDGGPYALLHAFDLAYSGGIDGSLTKANEHFVRDIPNVGAAKLDVRIAYTAGNNWWFAVDNVVVTGTRAGATTPTAELVSPPANGTLVGGLNPDGSFTYSPNPAFFGTDTFQYKVFNGVGFTNTATVSIDVISGRDLVWTGAVDANWDVNLSNNWTVGGATTYKQDDRVLFDNTAAVKTAQLNATVLPGSVTVNAVASIYTIQGSGKISGTSGLTLVNGKLVLATANDYTGGTSIAAGSTLELGAGGAVGSITGAITNNGALVHNKTGTSTYGPIAGTGTITQSAGTLVLAGVNTPSAVTVNGTGFLQVINETTLGVAPLSFATAGTRLITTGAVATFANNVSYGAINGQVRIITPTASVTTFNGTLSGGTPTTEYFIQAGASGTNNAVLALNGNNSIQGKINVQRGPVSLGSATAAGTASLFLDSNLNPGGVVRLTGNFTINNNIVINFGSLNPIGVDGATQAGINGVISSNGALGIRKVGTGALTLGGVNTYTGATEVAAGTLLVDGSIATSTGVSTLTGATIGGSGTLPAVTVAGTITGGTISGAGTLSTGNLTLTGAYAADLLGMTSHDALAVTGTVDVTGATLSITAPNPLAGGAKFTIIANDNTDGVIGKFANLPNEGDTISAGGQNFTISYVGGVDGNDVVLTRVGAAVPGVTSFTINNGDNQRSRLTSLTVNFASAVSAASFSGTGAIKLIRLESGMVPATVQTGATGSDGLITVTQGSPTSLVLTFSNASGAPSFPGSSVEFGSLSDGRWRLEIPSAAGYMSNPAAVNEQIPRLFGDINNDGTVDGGLDFGQFGTTFGLSAGVPAFLAAFDFNNDGTIEGGADFAEFGARFGVSI